MQPALPAVWNSLQMATGGAGAAQAARIMACSGSLLLGSSHAGGAQHAHLPLPNAQQPSWAHALSTQQQEQQQQRPNQLFISSGAAALLALQRPMLHMPWPLAVSGYMAPPPLGMPAPGTRHISFFRMISGSSERKSVVPDAADADAALKDYQELQARLQRIQRPSSIRTTTQVIQDTLSAVGRGLLAVWRFLLSLPARVSAWRNTTPEEWAKWRAETWATIKHEAHHYWVGTKLLGYEVRIASRHAWKAAQGKPLSRRERAQLTRTTADLFRLVPMIIIIVIPFLEFLLPVLLRLFPNMLPSTFEDKLKKEEELKRRLVLRLEIAKFLQDTVAEMATDIARRKGGSTDAQALHTFIQKVRLGQPVDNAEIIRFARLFNDELTLDNLDRLQLVSMCQFVGISPFGTDAFLRTRLRQHLQQIKHDDFEIEQEGIEHLTEEELRAECRARGMRAYYGEGAERYMRRQLQDWLDLSLHRGLPSSLLLLSRAFTITAGQPLDVGAAKDAKYEKLKETLGVIPEEVVDSVALEQLGGAGQGIEALQQRLLFLKREEEAIRAELERAEQASKAAAVAEAAMQHAIQQGKVAGTVQAAADAQAGASAAGAGAAEAAPVLHAAPHEEAAPVVEAGSLVAPEEAAAAAAATREARVKAVVRTLMDMATGSAVAQERAVFMSLMRREMERVNAVLADSGKGSSTGTMSFSAKGLEMAKDNVLPPEEEAHLAAMTSKPLTPMEALPSRLGDRVSRMLARIEKELDAVETTIGRRLHVLDTDADGKVTAEELETAMGFLRTQLSPQEMAVLLAQLKSAAKESGVADEADGGIKVSELFQLATTEDQAASGDGSPALPTPAPVHPDAPGAPQPPSAK